MSRYTERYMHWRTERIMSTSSTSVVMTRFGRRTPGFAASTGYLAYESANAVEISSKCPKKCPIAGQATKKFSRDNEKDTPKGAPAKNDYPWDWTPRQHLAWAIMWAALPAFALLEALGVL